jgi:DNA-binding transcriptional regulator GbsR (MarR family)
MRRLRSKTQLEMIGLGGRLCRRLGMPRITGQIYGLLFLATEPLSLDDIVAVLGVSKASASMGTRQLQAWGAIRQTWAPGDRRDYYLVVEDLGGLLRSGYKDFLKPRLQASRRRLEALLALLEEELAQGVITREEFKTCGERLRNLCRLQKRFQAAAPLLERLL